VPELWLYRSGKVKILDLRGEQIRESDSSLAFSAISVEQLQTWVELRQTGTDLTVIKAVRQFVAQAN